MERRFEVEEAHAGERLDVYLATELGIARAQVQKAIKSGAARLNDAPAKAHAPVQPGDVVLYATEETKEVVPEPVANLDILFENDDVLVINKPSGLLVHPTASAKSETTVVDAVRKHFPKIDSVGEDTNRPGIVHRLDKDVSGVMVIAKTQAMFEALKEQFAGRTVEKEYVALVYGVLNKEYDEIAFRLARSKSKGRMVSRPDSQEGKEAVTQYDVVQRFKTTTLVRVKILTGRTHQIRAHFKGIGHPIVGDKLYKRTYMKHIRAIPLPRVFLHAQKLSFTLPDGSRKTFEAPIPEELNHLLTTLTV